MSTVTRSHTTAQPPSASSLSASPHSANGLPRRSQLSGHAAGAGSAAAQSAAPVMQPALESGATTSAPAANVSEAPRSSNPNSQKTASNASVPDPTGNALVSDTFSTPAAAAPAKRGRGRPPNSAARQQQQSSAAASQTDTTPASGGRRSAAHSSSPAAAASQDTPTQPPPTAAAAASSTSSDTKKPPVRQSRTRHSLDASASAAASDDEAAEPNDDDEDEDDELDATHGGDSDDAAESVKTRGGAGGTHSRASGSRPKGSRLDCSLTQLTKSFLELVRRAPDGLVDLNAAAEELQVKKRRIYDITNVMEGIGVVEKRTKNKIQWSTAPATSASSAAAAAAASEDSAVPPVAAANSSSGGSGVLSSADALERLAALHSEAGRLRQLEMQTDSHVRQLQQLLRRLTQDDPQQRRYAYVTPEDIRAIPQMATDALISIRAPAGSKLEVADPDQTADDESRRVYQFSLKSSGGPIDVCLVGPRPEPASSSATAQPRTNNLPSPTAAPSAAAAAVSSPTKLSSRLAADPAQQQQQQPVLLPSHSSDDSSAIFGDLPTEGLADYFIDDTLMPLG